MNGLTAAEMAQLEHSPLAEMRLPAADGRAALGLWG